MNFLFTICKERDLSFLSRQFDDFRNRRFLRLKDIKVSS